MIPDARNHREAAEQCLEVFDILRAPEEMMVAAFVEAMWSNFRVEMPGETYGHRDAEEAALRFSNRVEKLTKRRRDDPGGHETEAVIRTLEKRLAAEDGYDALTSALVAIAESSPSAAEDPEVYKLLKALHDRKAFAEVRSALVTD